MWTGIGMRFPVRGAILAPVKILAAELMTSAAAPEGFPAHALPEVAVIGRSNVGKSSLINRITGRRSLARASATPGKTRLLNFFRVARPEGEIVLVDLPGYGYAKVSRVERHGWQALIERYLERRDNLRLAILLQDVRRDPGPDEIDLLPWLAARGVPVVGAATKVDRLSARERGARLAALTAAGLPIEWIPTSGRTGEGVDALWAAIDRAIRGDRAVPAGSPGSFYERPTRA
jgi:GTP-binding protein